LHFFGCITSDEELTIQNEIAIHIEQTK